MEEMEICDSVRSSDDDNSTSFRYAVRIGTEPELPVIFYI